MNGTKVRTKTEGSVYAKRTKPVGARSATRLRV